jgi:hypothetical protein
MARPPRNSWSALTVRACRAVAAKYGEHVYDQWSVDQLLELSSRVPRPTAEAP